MVTASLNLELGPRESEAAVTATADPVYPSVVLDFSPSPEPSEEPDMVSEGSDSGENIIETTITAASPLKTPRATTLTSASWYGSDLLRSCRVTGRRYS